MLLWRLLDSYARVRRSSKQDDNANLRAAAEDGRVQASRPAAVKAPCMVGVGEVGQRGAGGGGGAHLVRVAGRLVVVGVGDEPRHHAQQREGLDLQVRGCRAALGLRDPPHPPCRPSAPTPHPVRTAASHGSLSRGFYASEKHGFEP